MKIMPRSSGPLPCWRQQLSYNMMLLYIFFIVLICPASPLPTTADHPFIKDPDNNLSIQFISEQNTLIDKRGNEFSLDNVQPYTQLFSPETFVFVNHGKAIVNKRTRDVFDISVYRGDLEDGSVVLLSKNANNEVNYVVLLTNGGDDGTTHFLLQDDEPGAFLAIADKDYDYDKIAESFEFKEESKPPTRLSYPKGTIRPESDKSSKKASYKIGRGERSGRNSGRHTQAFNFVNGDGTSEECDAFYVIPLTIFFDADFCQLYNGELLTAVSSVQTIVAVASLYFENNLCARLKLTGIYWDTTSCNPADSAFSDFNREQCGSYLDDFTAYAEAERGGLGIDSSSYIHLFTGLPLSGSLGCSWFPGVCGSEFVYGVEYMSFLFPDIAGPAFILAHELGHNLNSPHDDPTSSAPPDYIMEANFNTGSDGFSPLSAEIIIDSFQDPLNFCINLEPVERPTAAPSRSPTRQPTDPPTPNPTDSPTQQPSPQPTTSPPSFRPTPLPSRQPSDSPSLNPTDRPTQQPSPQPTTSPPSLRPTPLPSRQPSPVPTTNAPSLRPTHETVLPPTIAPSPLPTNMPTTALPTPFPITPQPSPIPTTAAPSPTTATPSFAPSRESDRCEIDRTLVDPVCIHASKNVNDFACYNKQDLLVFDASTPDCESRAELSVDFCTDRLLPYPGSPAFDDDARRNLFGWNGEYRPLDSVVKQKFYWKRVSEIWELAPSCSSTCSEVGNMICFRSTTVAGFDRWFRVRYTVRDPLSRSKESMSVFVVIKENGQLECSNEDFFTCQGDGTQTRRWSDEALRRIGK